MNEIIKKNGINYGIITGVISILITTIIYSTNLELFMSGWITFLKVLIFGAISVILISKTKKELKGIISFKDAFTTYFISILIGLALAIIFEIILFNFIDPSLKDTLKEMSIKFTAELLQKFGAPSSEINKAIEQIQKNDQFSIGQQIQGFFVYVVIASIFGLILAAIFKSKPSYQQ
ncbi:MULTISPECIES: DUF4199 domain-containing protein [Flavobacterium]|uniref:DUF4199 domain-containing protein n=1 Tax=Flavobacterium hankyongi TaxID=1176532 RepID=A0ABP9A8J6_9FLAO|nr:DUF4199 domain-containing protein [Flavobacterium sp. N1846]